MRKDIILYEDALKIAKNRNERYDTVQEYEDAFYFYEEKDTIQEGGDCGIVVLKKKGSLLRPFSYLLDGNRKVKEIGEPKRI